MIKVSSSLRYTENIFWVHTTKKNCFKSYNTKQYTGTFGKIKINVLLEQHTISHNKAIGILLAHTI
jgi:hypothetical protein